jgi:hypothetical protein
MAERRPIDGINRRNVLRGGLLAGAGMALIGVASTALTGTALASSSQPNWAFCENCNGMWYTGNETSGVCPYFFEGHIKSPSYNYSIYNNLGGGTGSQGNWRWCTLCQGVFYTGHSNGYCPGNNKGQSGHREGSGSFDYFLFYNQPIVSNPQSYWRWCGYCQGLYQQGPNGTQNGNCPMYESPLATANGNVYGPHLEGAGSFNYNVNWNGSF